MRHSVSYYLMILYRGMVLKFLFPAFSFPVLLLPALLFPGFSFREHGLQRFRSYCVPTPRLPSGFLLKKNPPSAEARDGYNYCETALR